MKVYNDEGIQITRTKIVRKDGEYVVKAFARHPETGEEVRVTEADYFTDDLGDAEGTADLMISLTARATGV